MEAAMNYDRKLVGWVSVECGRVILADPIFLRDWRAGPYVPEVEDPLNSYDEALKLTEGEPGHGAMLDETAVVLSAAGGDGRYPVYGLFGDGGCTRVEVVLSREAATPDERAAWPDEGREEEPPGGVDDAPPAEGRTYLPW
jgi:hypothetical protein